MTFTQTPPTVPGFYAWKVNPIGDMRIARVFGRENLFVERMGYQDDKIPVAELGGLWCRLVPADVVEDAFKEGCSCGFSRALGGLGSSFNEHDYALSRAKTVASGA